MAGSEGGEKHGGGESHYRCAMLLHPLRHRILRLMLHGTEAGVGEIAAELDEAPGRIAYHLRLLVRHNTLKVIPKCRPTPPHYRWSPDAGWAREKLGEFDPEDGQGGEFGDLSP